MLLLYFLLPITEQQFVFIKICHHQANLPLMLAYSYPHNEIQFGVCPKVNWISVKVAEKNKQQSVGK